MQFFYYTIPTYIQSIEFTAYETLHVYSSHGSALWLVSCSAAVLPATGIHCRAAQHFSVIVLNIMYGTN